MTVADIPKRSSGENWSLAEEEQLRLLYRHLVASMPGRSEPAVFARIDRLRVMYYKQWPFQPAPPLSEIGEKK